MRKAIAAFGAFAAILATSAHGGAAGSGERALVAEINRVRALHGLRPLRVDHRLTSVARSHSRAIIRRGRLSHGNVGRRLRRAGIRTGTFGENVAWAAGKVRARLIVARWLASPPHRVVLLAPDFRLVGIGTVTGSFAGFKRARVVTANFAGG